MPFDRPLAVRLRRSWRAWRRRIAALALGGVALAATPAGVALSTSPFDAPLFPIAVSADGRHLEDAAGKPFLIQGDTAWSLMAQLTREETALYLADRRARGFNTILASLIEHRFADDPPANAYGDQPFLSPGDFTTPNPRYFTHVDWVLELAREQGFLVLLVPAYVGAGGGDQGWYQAMAKNGPDRLRQYGGWLGQRYSRFDNILWVHGGDDNPPDRNLLRAIADGIRQFDKRALHSAHPGVDTTALEYWKGTDFIAVNSLYTYGPVHVAALNEYARGNGTPFFLIEGLYENEHGVTVQRLRAQAYEAILSGATGQVFGNNPIWHFDGPGLFRAPVGWRAALDGPGSRSMTQVRRLMTELEWWRLEPDIKADLLVDGAGSGLERAVAAVSRDREFAVLYLPTPRTITIDLSRLGGPRVDASWIDPSNGLAQPVSGSPFKATGRHTIQPHAVGNGPATGDRVLVLRSAP